jgi:hypothetical protein
VGGPSGDHSFAGASWLPMPARDLREVAAARARVKGVEMLETRFCERFMRGL